MDDIGPALVFIIIGLAVYFIPSGMAVLREHSQLPALFLLNLFLGWTFLGWVAALVWAFINQPTVAQPKED